MFLAKISFQSFCYFVKFVQMLLNSIVHTLQQIFLFKWKGIMCLLFKQENNDLLSYVQSLVFLYVCVLHIFITHDCFQKIIIERIL